MSDDQEQHDELRIEFDRELDGRWIATAPEVWGEPSVYGSSKLDALRNLIDVMESITTGHV